MKHPIHEAALPADAVLSGGDVPFIRYFPGLLTQVAGTLAALRDEGWVPDSVELPNGTAFVYWDEGGVRFGLRREKPLGWVGPRSSWSGVDWWMVRIQPENDALARGRLHSLQAEVDLLKRRAPAIGRFGSGAQWEGLERAREDGAFQRMLTAVLPPVASVQRGRGRPLSGGAAVLVSNRAEGG